MIIHSAAIDLASSWSLFWAQISPSYNGPLKTTVIVVGISLVLWAVIKYLWDKRRGQGAKSSPMWWTLLFGGVLLAPDVLLPVLLRLLSWAINLALTLVSNVWQ